jgi:lipopolysaccharide transport system permease protein
MASFIGKIKANVLAPGASVIRNRSLIIALSKREVLGRYRGASFGLFWSILSPFLMLCVYAFAFGSILNSRWPQPDGAANSFAIILFVGLIVHGFFAECFTRAPALITNNVSYVKKVIFPIEILPWPMVISALFHTLMNVVVLIILRLLVDHQFSWSILLLPVVLLPLVILMLGIGWFLAALGVYIRDIAQITGVLSTALLFTSSAVVPVNAIPEEYRFVFSLNPLTFIIDQAREVSLWGGMPDWAGLGLYALVSAIFALVGYTWFSATRRGFGDVL